MDVPAMLTPVVEWLERVVEDPAETCEILSELLGDDLTMIEFSPTHLDDDQLGARALSYADQLSLAS